MGKSQAVMSIDDRPMWDGLAQGELKLQRCCNCHTLRYPPGPICASCLSMDSEWVPVTGTGTILSWVIFHKRYFDDFPPPYNAVAVRLEEGPIIMSNLVGQEPAGSWIGKRVRLEFVEHEGRKQHAVRIDETA